jgi:hypothetical protein
VFDDQFISEFDLRFNSFLYVPAVSVNVYSSTTVIVQSLLSVRRISKVLQISPSQISSYMGPIWPFPCKSKAVPRDVRPDDGS